MIFGLDMLLIFVLSTIIATPVFLANIRLAPRLGLIDWPKARGLTEEQIPIVGHSMILLSVATMVVLNHLYGFSPWFTTTAVLMAIMGHLDDRKPLPPLDKMFFQVLCVATVVFLDPQIDAAMGAKYGVWGSFLAGFFILGLMNAINFIDGIDGLAGLVIIVGSLGYLFFQQLLPQNYSYSVLACVILGMTIPFLYFNVIKRKGFLGNVGSYFFSYCLAVMHVSLPLGSPDPISRLSLSGLCFLIPIADSLMVIMVRLATFRSPFQPDKGHLHHRLIQTSIPLRWILFNFAIIELGALMVAVLLERSGATAGRSLPLFVCFSHVSITALLILLVEKGSRRRIQGYFQRMDRGEPIYFLKYRFANHDGSPVGFRVLTRLEAKVSSEIRVTDLCFIEHPDCLFVTLRTLPEPLKGISSRLDLIFQSEKVHSTLVLEQGEFVKIIASIPKGAKALRRRRTA